MTKSLTRKRRCGVSLPCEWCQLSADVWYHTASGRAGRTFSHGRAPSESPGTSWRPSAPSPGTWEKARWIRQWSTDVGSSHRPSRRVTRQLESLESYSPSSPSEGLFTKSLFSKWTHSHSSSRPRAGYLKQPQITPTVLSHRPHRSGALSQLQVRGSNEHICVINWFPVCSLSCDISY